MVRVSASSCVESAGLQNSRNQDSGNCIVRFFGVLFKNELIALAIRAFQYENVLMSDQDKREQLTFLRYWNCDRKRMSPSKNRRKSFTP